jgi:disulfide bond formation protein DsbB
MNQYQELATTLNHYFSLATIIGGVGVSLCIATVIYLLYKGGIQEYAISLKPYIYPVGFLTSLVGALITLLYSQVLGYAPCDLCWYQRVFLYPQIFLFALAWWKRDTAIFPYTLLLSIIGGVIALYHHMLQIGFDIMKPCSTAPFAVDCAKPSFIEFGFVTFPFMAVVLFAFLALVSFVGYISHKK